MRAIRTVSRETVLAPVHLWRLVSRILPPRCKYYPSCSQYCLDAVRSKGVVRGLALAGWRILRCNPWSLGGYDPVPAAAAATPTGTGAGADQHRSANPDGCGCDKNPA